MSELIPPVHTNDILEVLYEGRMGNEGDPVCLIDKFVIIVIKGNVEYGKNKVKITKVNPKSAFAEVVS